jgi:hypothetical protein
MTTGSQGQGYVLAESNGATLSGLFGIWRGLRPHRTTIEPSTRQFGLPA